MSVLAGCFEIELFKGHISVKKVLHAREVANIWTIFLTCKNLQLVIDIIRLKERWPTKFDKRPLPPHHPYTLSLHCWQVIGGNYTCLARM